MNAKMRCDCDVITRKGEIGLLAKIASIYQKAIHYFLFFGDLINGNNARPVNSECVGAQ